MLTDLTVPEVRADQAFPSDIRTAIAAMAGQRGLVVTSPHEVVIIAGDYTMLIRTLRSGAPSLGDLQLGRALRLAGADWATWAAHDLATGRVEAELRTVAEGSPAAGRTAP